MSAVKGLALGSGLPLIAVPTFEALAYQICTYLPVGTEFFIANKVNLEEVYNAKFHKVLDGYEFIDKLSVTWNEEFESRLNDKSLLFGNFVPGNNAVTTCGVSWPSASSVARWAYKFGKDSLTYDYDFLEPFYLKNFVIKEHK
jgi:tRNA A37 threonylcarbamoyladenosine modification protein TsaB